MKEIDRQPLSFYFGPWQQTIERWENEGLPKGSPWDFGMNLDPGICHVNVNLGFYPAFERTIIDENENSITIRDEYGILQEALKNNTTIPRIIETPVTDYRSWIKLRNERLDPESPERFPGDWNDLIKKYNEGDFIIQLGRYPFGLFGTLRDLMGVEGLLIAFYDAPGLIHEIMDYLTDFWLAIYKKVCRSVKVDAIHMWEDMSGKTGSLISPKMVRDFMMPNYIKIAAFAKENDIPIFSLDTDGDCSQLIPLFLESGINLVMPFEVAAGSDIKKYRKAYPDLCIMGGIDKREIAKGPAAIEKELDRIDTMFSGPGYWPAPDHLFHPEISYADFKYFVEALRKRVERK